MNLLELVFLDFYLFEYNVDFEIDGKQHDNRQKFDQFRDETLKKHGLIVYRIKWKSINRKLGKEYIKNEIEKFISFIRDVAQSGSARDLGSRG